MRIRLAVFLLASSVAQVQAQTPPEERVIKVTAKKFEYSPAVIELQVGVPVVLELTTLDRKHGFLSSALHLKAEIIPGQTTRVRFTPDKAGVFEFHCNVFCGSGHEGMEGQIVVHEAK